DPTPASVPHLPGSTSNRFQPGRGSLPSSCGPSLRRYLLPPVSCPTARVALHLPALRIPAVQPILPPTGRSGPPAQPCSSTLILSASSPAACPRSDLSGLLRGSRRLPDCPDHALAP